MKSAVRLLRQVPNATSKRCLSTSSSSNKDKSAGGGGGFFGNFFERRPIETQQQTHQSRLGGREDIIELQTHNVRPGASSEYRDAHAQLCKYVAENRELFRCEALGNFRVLVGEEDQVKRIVYETENVVSNTIFCFLSSTFTCGATTTATRAPTPP